jgi:hypothetical protein
MVNFIETTIGFHGGMKMKHKDNVRPLGKTSDTVHAAGLIAMGLSSSLMLTLIGFGLAMALHPL